MAGTRIVLDDGFITVTDSGIGEALERLAALGEDHEAVWKDVAEYLYRQTEERFDTETSPSGQPWEDVKPETRAQKKHPKILTERGHLRGSFDAQPSPDELIFGTIWPYAATHQFGRDSITARPMIGIGPDDMIEIGAIFMDHIDEAAKGG